MARAILPIAAGMDPFESARGENGFSLIEVLIAMFVIAVGVLGTVALIDRANAQTSGTKVRQTANALLRNLLETSQGLPYAQVASATLVSTLQSNGFADDVPASSSTWEIKRNGVTFTIAATACKVDDPSDGQGAHPAGGDFCSDSAAGSGDGNPTTTAA